MESVKITEMSLILPFTSEGKVLLGWHVKHQKRNGFGGKREEEDQAIEDTAVRESEQEGSIQISKDSLEKIGINYYIHAYKNEIWKVFIFKVVYDGDYKDSSEMLDLKLFDILDIPYEDMRESDKKWLKKYLHDGNYFEYTGYYDSDRNLINWKEGLCEE